MSNLRHVDGDIVTADNTDLANKLDESTIKDAAKADAAEHQMSLKEAFFMHKKAIFWSMALSGALIMEGYDVVVVSSASSVYSTGL
jgi:SP family general alpha glucoside:H+ symporter-like MFS transporter